jgi:hypothetical protein
MLLADVSPHVPDEIAGDVARLREAIAQVLAAEHDGPTVLVVSGDTLGVTIAPGASLASYGHPQAAATLAVGNQHAAPLASALGVELEQAETLHGDDAVLALHVVAQDPHAPLLVLRLPADTVAIDAAAEALAGLAGRVVAACDLAATLTDASPGAKVDGAEDFDSAVVEAVAAVDVAALDVLGPAEAARVLARGWAPVRLLVALAGRTGQAPVSLLRLAPRGVGLLVVRMAP